MPSPLQTTAPTLSSRGVTTPSAKCGTGVPCERTTPGLEMRATSSPTPKTRPLSCGTCASSRARRAWKHPGTLSPSRFGIIAGSSTGQQYIYSGCSTGRVVVYDLLSGLIVKKLINHQACVRDVSWHPYEEKIVSTSASIGRGMETSASGSITKQTTTKTISATPSSF
ncbi:hypothetical protein Chor_009687 [Crotalus horridus]